MKTQITIIRLTGSVILLLSLILAASCAEKPDKSRPNILFILVDDMGYGDLSCYGQELFETPNIDKLASEGMRFTSCYAGCTVCAPSRSVLRWRSAVSLLRAMMRSISASEEKTSFSEAVRV